MSSLASFEPRKGQRDLIEYLPLLKAGDRLSVQWPTGYGKSIGFALAWKHCYRQEIANRLLLIVANDTQRQQIINDFAGDCAWVDAPCNGGIWSFERSASDIQAAIRKTAEVFVCTVQQLEASNRGGLNTLKELLTCGGTRWMTGFDEFHHYGEDMPWGDAAKSSMQYSAFTMAMSATPYRRGADIIFPEPRHVVTYAQAVREKAIKPMVCHSYEYKVTVNDQDGESSYTTTELLDMAPEGIDQWEERKNIRYSPQYIHPLILHPLTRLMQKRAESGQRLQMLIRAMSCRHAEMICRQVRTYLDNGVRVDWIGTGPHGRDQEANDSIRLDFCPAKIKGVRPAPSLDILVQVSMAGEGFDSINVAEIVDLFPVSKKAASGRATADKQFYGRGSRLISKSPDMRLHVSVPSDHPLHVWAGLELHQWMDSSGENVIPKSDEEDKERQIPDIDLFEFPDLPRKREIELLNITMEDEHFKAFAREAAVRRGYDLSQDKSELFELYKKVAMGVAAEQSEQARLVQAKEGLDAIVARIGYVLASQTTEINGTVIGRFKKQINEKVVRRFGKRRDGMLLEDVELAHTWLQNYLRSLKSPGK